ncbi:hypothetical protein [Desulfocicer niacini]
MPEPPGPFSSLLNNATNINQTSQVVKTFLPYGNPPHMPLQFLEMEYSVDKANNTKQNPFQQKMPT